MTSSQVRPVLKWAGGKSQLLAELLRGVPHGFRAYHEPFVGGGALFFGLARQGRLTTAYLSDVNRPVIDVYLGLRECVDEVIRLLKEHRYDESYYYQIRALKAEDLSLPERAARVIYLNRTCYNGLYRENRAGQFNVPFGRYKNPTICDEPNLRAAAVVLQGVDLSCRHFSSVLQVAQPGDFVYFDPPYHPLPATSSFTAYDRHGFGPEDQVELWDVFAELTQRRVKAMLSNSDTLFICQLYEQYRISRVLASRAINSKASSRGKITEVIVYNYPAEEGVQRILLDEHRRHIPTVP
ncbi:MAG: DNA adenine methylase [Anaerolineae bacterium]|nr:DNA adenine methylase [Anaerolineae bacterium]